MPDPSPHFVVVDSLDPEAGVLEVEFTEGFTGQLPAWWLPDAAEGRAYRVSRTADGLRFDPDDRGARVLRERSKQALLDFTDELDD